MLSFLYRFVYDSPHLLII